MPEAMGERIISETACARDKSGGPLPLPLVMGTVSHLTLSETIVNQMPAIRRSPIRSVIPAKPVPDLPVPLQDGRVLSGSGNPEKPKIFRDAARVQACVASKTWGRSSVTRMPPGRRVESNVPSAVGAGRCPTCLRGAASRQDRCRYPVCLAVSSVGSRVEPHAAHMPGLCDAGRNVYPPSVICRCGHPDRHLKCEATGKSVILRLFWPRETRPYVSFPACSRAASHAAITPRVHGK